MRALSQRGMTAPGVVLCVLAVVGLLAALVAVRGAAEGAVAALANWLSVGYAFGAGMVASVNPCGFMLLPAYVSYQLGAGEETYRARSVASRILGAVEVGLTATLGFVLVFGVAGGVVAAGGHWLGSAFPQLGAGVALVLLVLGLYVLAGGRVPVVSVATNLGGARRGRGAVFLYGVAYAIGSLGCTLPIFIVVMGSAVAAGDVVLAVVQLVGYALGMGTVLVAVALSAALFRGAVARWLRGLLPYVHLLGALFMVAAGGYLLYYWLAEVGLAR